MAAVKSDDPAAGVQLFESESKKLQKQTYKGVPYEIDENGDAFGAIGDYVALGDPPAYTAAIDASQGESLADSQRFKDSVEKLPSDSLGRVYGDVQGLIARVAKQQGAPVNTVQNVVSQLGIEGTFTAAAQAGDKSISLDLNGVPGLGTAQPSTALATLPGDAWFALGLGDLGGKIKNLVDNIEAAGIPGLGKGTISAVVQDRTNINLATDVFPWMGDAAIFIRGTEPGKFDGALVIESKDSAAADRAINFLRDFVQSTGQGKPQPLDVDTGAGTGGNGFKLVSPSAPQAVNFVQQNGKVVVGLGDSATQEALSPSKTLSEVPAFAAAKSAFGDTGPSFFVSAEQALEFLAASASGSDPGFKQVEPYLQRLLFLAAGGDNGLKITLGAK
ncbi:MAG: DUF3352 domain-containing protein [Actinobacteria bacterium]|nr:DUF3352 domain-containing protein [Actinomycetota bacterium]